MCGINGFSWPDTELLKRMNDAIAHRGPDDSGTFVDKRVSLGHLRLAIVDLTPTGHQPMRYTHDGRTVTIVFNGEIYNYKDVRENLKNLGYKFTSESDTEVILAAYLAWGFECVQQFNGMWAFALYDEQEEILFCSRDRFGKKPFHYSERNGHFVFSSELKALTKHEGLTEDINLEAVGLYFAMGFIPAPHTIYRGVVKLEAGHNLIYDLTAKRTVKIWQYYTFPRYAPQRDRKALIEEGRELLKDAVRVRLIADVPVGAFLSGGLDSSAVVGEMAAFTDLHNLHTFSVGFEGKYDETPYVSIAKDAFGTRHHHTYFTKEDFDRIVSKHADIYDEPYGDTSGFPTYALSAFARKQVTVALSGDGGDEVFGGYPWHVAGRRMELIRKVPKGLRNLGSRLPVKRRLDGYYSLYTLKQALALSLHNPESFYAKALPEDMYHTQLSQAWTESKLKEALNLANGDLAEGLRIYDLLHHTIPDHFLVKVDRASMANALEVRSPFLDYRLAEYSQRIPRDWKVDSFATKKLMREIITGIVPEAIVRRGKQGFTPPFEEWIRDERYQKIIHEGMTILERIEPTLHAFYREKVLGRTHRLSFLYRTRLFLFTLWWRRWQV